MGEFKTEVLVPVATESDLATIVDVIATPAD